MISCCCAPRWGWPNPNWPSGGPTFSCCPKSSASHSFKRARRMRRAPLRRKARRKRRVVGVVGVDAAERPAVNPMRPLWRPAYVAVGSNLNQPLERVREGFERLATLRETRLELRSRNYLTSPMGPQDQPNFVNAVAGLLTRLSARELLDALLDIERAMGRRPQERWGP